MDNEIKNEEMVYEVEESNDVKSSGKAGKVVIGVAAAIGAGYVLCKKVVKPIINKVKAKKENVHDCSDNETVEDKRESDDK